MKKVRVSAPEIVYISGKDTWKFGNPAFIAAANMRSVVTVYSSSQKTQTVSKITQIALHIVQKLHPQTEIPSVSIEYSSSANLLGSPISLPLLVSLVGALDYFISRLWNPHTVQRVLFDHLKDRWNGGEISTCVFGGFMWYREELSFLKSLWQLPIKTTAANHFYIHRLKTPLKRKNTKFDTSFLKHEEELTKKLVEAFKTEDEKNLITYIQLYSSLTQSLYKQVPQMERLQKALGRHGSSIPLNENWVLCYHDKPEIHIPADISLVPIHVGEEGIRLEEKT